MADTDRTTVDQLGEAQNLNGNDLLYIKQAAAGPDGRRDKKTPLSQVRDFVYPPVASVQTTGLVNIEPQAFAGKKTFRDGVSTSTIEASGHATFSDDTTVGGDLHVNGNIIQQGESYETEVETLAVKDEIIKTRDGATTGMASGEFTGLQAEKYNGTLDGRLVFGADGVARVGDYTPPDGNTPAIDDTQPLATREETPIDGAIQLWDEANTMLKSIAKGTSGQVLTSNGPDADPSFQNLSSIFFNIVWPVGKIKPQYPGEPAPDVLYAGYGTFQEVTDFSGMFFRSEGGNAKTFTHPFACTVSGATVTFTNPPVESGTVYENNKPTTTQLSVGDLLVGDGECRRVTAISASGDTIESVTVESAFSSNITTVMIGQADAIKSHTSGIQSVNHSHSVTVKSMSDSGYTNYAGYTGVGDRNGSANTLKSGPFSYPSVPGGASSYAPSTSTDRTELYMNINHAHTTSVDNNSTNHNHTYSGDVETRSINCTFKLWKRTA